MASSLAYAIEDVIITASTFAYAEEDAMIAAYLSRYRGRDARICDTNIADVVLNFLISAYLSRYRGRYAMSKYIGTKNSGCQHHAGNPRLIYRCGLRKKCFTTPCAIIRDDLDGLYYALRHHGLSHFHEASHVGTLDIIDVTVSLSAILDALLMDAVHDLVQTSVNIGCIP